MTITRSELGLLGLSYSQQKQMRLLFSSARSHLPRLQALNVCTAVSTEGSSPWLTLQHIIKCIRQSVHSFVNVILWSEVRNVQKLSVYTLDIFVSSAGGC